MSSPPSDTTTTATPASSSEHVSSPSMDKPTIESIKAAHRAKMIADGVPPAELPGPKKRAKRAPKTTKSPSKVSKDVVPVANDAKSAGAADDEARNVTMPETANEDPKKPKKAPKAAAKAKKATKSKKTHVSDAVETPETPVKPSKKRKAVSDDTVGPTAAADDETEQPAAKKAKKPPAPKNTPKRTPRSKKRTSPPAATTPKTPSPSPSETPDLSPALAAKVAQVQAFLSTLPDSERLALFSPVPRTLIVHPTDLCAALIAVDADYSGNSNVPADSEDEMFERVRPMLLDEAFGDEGVVLDLGVETVFLSGIHDRLEGTGVQGVNVLEVQVRMLETEREGWVRALGMGTPVPRFLGVGEEGELGAEAGAVVQRVEDPSGDFFAEAWERVLEKEEGRMAAVAAEVVEAIVEGTVKFVETEKAREVTPDRPVVASIEQVVQ